MGDRVFVDWRDLDDDDDDGWDQIRCLYAYWAPNGELLYIGKAWSKTVRQRWRREAKLRFWNGIERDLAVFEHCVSVGTIALPPDRRLTAQLLSDVESLLIQRVGPWGNCQCRLSRIERPGLVLCCRDDWFMRQETFRDVA